MESSLRNTPALMARIDKLRDDLIKRYENLVELAVIKKTDRTTTAVMQYQMQVETAALIIKIRSAEDVQTLIRRLQEMWLFGQLDTIGESKIQQQTNENTKKLAALLQQLVERDQNLPADTAGDVTITDSF